jgi:hypothetical protein
LNTFAAGEFAQHALQRSFFVRLETLFLSLGLQNTSSPVCSMFAGPPRMFDADVFAPPRGSRIGVWAQARAFLEPWMARHIVVLSPLCL